MLGGVPHLYSARRLTYGGTGTARGPPRPRERRVPRATREWCPARRNVDVDKHRCRPGLTVGPMPQKAAEDNVALELEAESLELDSLRRGEGGESDGTRSTRSNVSRQPLEGMNGRRETSRRTTDQSLTDSGWVRLKAAARSPHTRRRSSAPGAVIVFVEAAGIRITQCAAQGTARDPVADRRPYNSGLCPGNSHHLHHAAYMTSTGTVPYASPGSVTRTDRSPTGMTHSLLPSGRTVSHFRTTAR